MTRLIDGDALIELINGGYDLDFNEVPETKRELLRMIMEQPTVDAIPIAWINDWYDTYMYSEVGDLLNDWAERKEE